MSLLSKISAAYLFVTLCLHSITCLQLTELQVQSHALLGARVAMQCQWVLTPSDVQYSVKWYKDGDEFFRYVPRDGEPLRKFPLPGVDVEEFDTCGSNLTLAPANEATSGRYRCEVSGEKPRFQTVSKYADLLAVALPPSGPSIRGLKSHYRVGGTVNVSCTPGRASQASEARRVTQLAWYINGKPAASSTVRRHQDTAGETSSYIEFVVEDRMVGVLKLKCLATVSSIFWRSVEESAVISSGILQYDEISKDSATLSNATIVTLRNEGLQCRSSLPVSLSMLCILYFLFRW